MKKIAVGGLGEFWYGDYKEPFEQLEGAVPGHPVGVVLKGDDGKLLCAFCGKTFDNLGQHANVTHGLPAAQYKREVGLLQKSALISERGRQRAIATALRNHATNAAWRVPPVPTIVQRAHPGDSNGMRSPERRNRTGTCYTQIMAAARTIQVRKGRVTLRDLAAIGIHPVTLLQYFPTVEAFFDRILQTSTTLGPSKASDELLALLRAVAEHLGRPPTKSDLRRFGLPDAGTYRRRFGTYRTALVKAGLDPDLPAIDGTSFAVSAFTAYATLGSMIRTASHLHVGLDRIERLMAQYGAPFTPNTPVGRDNSTRREWAADMARRLAGTEVAA